ncbi:hypothetical protein Leryth_001700 [Lithospermum erythrorhizon]|nr:hypothetical protein Leryth_001700 [Lithospermum erythrorhizon]
MLLTFSHVPTGCNLILYDRAVSPSHIHSSVSEEHRSHILFIPLEANSINEESDLRFQCHFIADRLGP